MRNRTIRIMTLAVILTLFAATQSEAECTWTPAATSIGQTCGWVGIGTLAPAAPLDVRGWTGAPSDVVGVAVTGSGDFFVGNAPGARMRLASNANQGFLQWNVYYNGSGYRALDANKPAYEMEINAVADQMSFKRYAASPAGQLNPTQATNILTLKGNGDAVFAGSVSGANIQAHFQDVAEWVPATSDLEPGTVVALNPARNNEVMTSSRSYDTTVAGVVSAQPGLILGVAGEGREQIATTGRVRVKVDARKHPIAVGDLLVSSETPGKAMRSVPLEIAGNTLHRPGTIIGKALEPLGGGEGEILVLLSMQ